MAAGQNLRKGVRGIGCTGSCLAAAIGLIGLGLFSALVLAAGDCSGSNCDGHRLDAIALGLAIGALSGFAGGALGGLGSWISKSRERLPRYLIGLAAGLTTPGAIALIIMGFRTSFDGGLVLGFCLLAIAGVLWMATYQVWKQTLPQ
jgi:hypothetical protein